jgi:hypothetical protein
VIGLEKKNFDILDQNNQELIRHFSSEDAPISLGIIFDTSDSMWGKIERSREAVAQFFRTSNRRMSFFSWASINALNFWSTLLIQSTKSKMRSRR